MTGSPAAFSALALASTASVADSAMPPIRAEMRRRAGGSLVVWLGSGALCSLTPAIVPSGRLGEFAWVRRNDAVPSTLPRGSLRKHGAL